LGSHHESACPDDRRFVPSREAEILRDRLVSQLQAANVDAEAISIPFTSIPSERLIEEMLMARSPRLTNADRVIALRFPAYLVPLERNVI
jgi:hypothetical protein